MIKTKRKRLRGIVQQVLRPFLSNEAEKARTIVSRSSSTPAGAYQ